MRTFTYVIIDDDSHRAQKTLATAKAFPYLTFLGFAGSFDSALDLVLAYQPQLILLEIDPEDSISGLSLHFISELHRYLTQLPKVIITTKNDTLCLQAFKYGVYDYLLHPIETKELRKVLLRFEKEQGLSLSNTVQLASDPTTISEDHTIIDENSTSVNQIIEEAKKDSVPKSVDFQKIIEVAPESIASEEDGVSLQMDNSIDDAHDIIPEKVIIDEKPSKPLVICVKSYGDYRYIDASEICYLQADNNSTDIHLNTGEMITAFKTLKHFEGILVRPFVRIHNSYIVNIDYISRIHTGNSVCHLKNSTVKLPFSKSYKENIEQIINNIASGNYLEI